MKTTASIAALAGAALLSACSTLLPPEHISDAQIADLGPQQLQGVQQARGRMPEAQRALAQASQEVNAREKEFTVAQRFWDWKNLKLEQAKTRRELALARIDLVETRIQAEKARAVVQAHPEMAREIKIQRYTREVNEAQAEVQELEGRIQELEGLIGDARVNFQAAREKYGLGPDGGTPPRAPGTVGGDRENDDDGGGLQTVPMGG